MPVTDTLIIDRILNTAILRRASDIHFVIGSYPILRIAGQLIQLTDEKLVDSVFMTALLNYFFGNDFVKDDTEKEASTMYAHGDQARLRVRTYKQRGDWAITIKRINDRLPLLETIPYGNLVKPLLNDSGLIVINGPYNSGKTTVSAVILQYINTTFNKRIVTIEDPIERLFINDRSIIEQLQVNRDITSVSDGLHDLLDQDVDVVIVGKLEKADELEQMLLLVGANKLVIVCTDHTTVTSCLLAWQGMLPPEKHEWFNQVIGDYSKLFVAQEYVPGIMAGDQVLVAEVMLVADNIGQSISGGKLVQLEGLLNSSTAPSLISFDNALIDAVNRGLIEPVTALTVAHNRTFVQSRIGNRFHSQTY